MRLLRERRDHDRQGFPGSESESGRRRHPAGDVRRVVPVRRERSHDSRDQALCAGGESMKPADALRTLTASMTPDASAALERSGMSRRRFIKGSGALIVGFSAARLTNGLGTAPGSAIAQRLDGAGSNQLDSWIAIAADGTVTAYTGKCELGHGLYTAQMQLIAEELV